LKIVRDRVRKKSLAVGKAAKILGFRNVESQHLPLWGNVIEEGASESKSREYKNCEDKDNLNNTQTVHTASSSASELKKLELLEKTSEVVAENKVFVALTSLSRKFSINGDEVAESKSCAGIQKQYSEAAAADPLVRVVNTTRTASVSAKSISMSENIPTVIDNDFNCVDEPKSRDQGPQPTRLKHYVTAPNLADDLQSDSSFPLQRPSSASNAAVFHRIASPSLPVPFQGRLSAWQFDDIESEKDF
jgi:hypothetical protein